jgi:pyruvate/2-oxoglutarate dehydrogenase complex dihydrolipoamide dehydrogenase (E3) component
MLVLPSFLLHSTHYAGYQGAIAARNILLPLSDPGVLSDVPASTFTSPEVASIGYTEAQARKELGDKVVGVSKMNLDEVDRALCDGNRIGILKVLYHKRNGKILGATVMAPAAGELISEIAVARSAGMTFDALAKVIHPYPSYAMALQLMAADVYYEKTTQMLWLYNFLKRIGL